MRFSAREESWTLKEPFAISRETVETVPMVFLELDHGGFTGRTESIGVDYHGETPGSIIGEIEAYLGSLRTLPTRTQVLAQLPPGGARNAIDLALWDLEAKRAGKRVWELAGLPRPFALRSCYTLSLAAPPIMAEAVSQAPLLAPLKLKLGGGDGLDVDRVAAVRSRAPTAEIVVDVNQAWSLDELNAYAGPLAKLGVKLIEQPLPAGQDEALDDYVGPVPLCADESFNVAADIANMSAYRCVNVKLDKCGGLTAALEIAAEARKRALDLFVGCMLGTSLGMAPAFFFGQLCRYVDLDGPLLLATDRAPAIHYEGAMMQPFGPDVWG